MKVNEAIENAEAAGSEYLKTVKEAGQNLLDDAQSSGHHAWGQAKSLIRKHPGEAVGFAVLLGVVVGVLFSPKGRD